MFAALMPPVGMKFTPTYGAAIAFREREPTHRLGRKELERRETLLERRLDFGGRRDAGIHRNARARDNSRRRAD